ncbi:MAG: hypothetical protein J7M19_06195 [Planctomycetes bacterium]|nr:hypothetical protein [Planctomycetota bacterium]
MFGWATAVVAILGAGLVMTRHLRRQHTEFESLRNAVDETLIELRQVAPCQRDNALDDQVEDGYHMVNNLGRLNILLDQLNGLLHGPGEAADVPERRPLFFGEEWPPPPGGPPDFDSPEEFRKFDMMGPISGEELEDTDWDLLFKRIQTDSDMDTA